MTATSSALTSTDLLRLAGVTYRQLDYWTRVGLVPTVSSAHGSGTVRLYDRSVVEMVRAMGAVSVATERGPSRPGANQLMAAIARDPDASRWSVAVNGFVVTVERIAP